MTAFQAAESLDKSLRGTEGYVSIGVGDSSNGLALYVYATSHLNLHPEYNGYRVHERIVRGDSNDSLDSLTS